MEEIVAGRRCQLSVISWELKQLTIAISSQRASVQQSFVVANDVRALDVTATSANIGQMQGTRQTRLPSYLGRIFDTAIRADISTNKVMPSPVFSR